MVLYVQLQWNETGRGRNGVEEASRRGEVLAALVCVNMLTLSVSLTLPLHALDL